MISTDISTAMLLASSAFRIFMSPPIALFLLVSFTGQKKGLLRRYICRAALTSQHRGDSGRQHSPGIFCSTALKFAATI